VHLSGAVPVGTADKFFTQVGGDTMRSARTLATALAATLTAALIVVTMAVWTAGLTAQEPPLPKPGPEHEHFKELAGTWDATIHMKEGDSKGTMVSKVGLGGLWLLEHFKADLGGMSFEGMGATSYDEGKKKYVSVWIDSMSTSPMVSEGTYDKQNKTLTMTGSMPLPGGKSMKTTMTTIMKDADTMVFSLMAQGDDGKDGEMMKITYKRRSK
jgi:hypothetical protein